MTVPVTAYANETQATMQLINMSNGGRDRVNALAGIVETYKNTLAHGPYSHPFGVGQIVLNGAINNIKTLASQNGWTVPDIANPNPTVANPCYQLWLPYSP